MQRKCMIMHLGYSHPSVCFFMSDSVIDRLTYHCSGVISQAAHKGREQRRRETELLLAAA